jgi:AcrR family transcriptional regulator
MSLIGDRWSLEGLMTSKIRKNQEQKREKLLEAAFYLMTRKDLADISIAELAKEAGIAKGTFYLYFRDKYDLRDFLVYEESEKILNEAWERLCEHDIRDFEDSVIFLVDEVLKILEHKPVVLNFIKHNLSWGVFHGRLAAAVEKDAFNLVDRLKERALSDGWHIERPDILTFMILELVSAVGYNAILYKVPADMEQMRPYLYDSIRAILRENKAKTDK